MIITETDIDTRPTVFGKPFTEDDLMTEDEWWSEFRANACCPSPGVAARSLCGCGGSDRLPSETSRLLYDPEEAY